MLVKTAKVFVNKQGQFGNPVGIVIDDRLSLDKEKRQKIATDLNFSETVFINNLDKPDIQLFNPVHEVTFAGHAVLGTAYFFKHMGKKFSVINCGKNIISVNFDKELTWITAPLVITPPWNFKQLDTVEEIEKLDKDEYKNQEHIVVWAWIDKNKGLIRARTFASDWGIPEDEANGSGSMLLAAKLNQRLKIIHGLGSEILAKPVTDKLVQLGGLAILC